MILISPPRITGVCQLEGKCPFSLAILRKSRFDGSCDRMTYYYENIQPGFGFCVTTYASDGNPLPSFSGEPRLLPLNGRRKDIAEYYWKRLNDDNKVALAVRFIALDGTAETSIKNKYEKIV